MSVLEKLAKLNKQLNDARAMVQASDPTAAQQEHRAAVALIQRITGDVTLKHYDVAASAARELHAILVKMQMGWAMGQSSATGRVLTQVETLAKEIETELRALAKK
ncbi:MAG TPA: hypothetical protein VKB41_16250 [Steroidobacteraceae bacterium]|jgi:hypothetical protein|nr:hypothetical protein [Steroidobacteraceae bacterium]